MQGAEFLHVIVLSVCSFVALAVLTKFMGNRQMSQLTMLDYIIGISIGSIAAEMAIKPDAESWYGILAMVIYAGLAVSLNVLNDKSIRVRRVVLGTPRVLYERGTLYYNNLRRARLDLSEFLTQCRNAGYFDLSQLELVLLEFNGKLSFLPTERDRPLTPADMNLAPRQSRPLVPVVMDGVILHKQLKLTGYDENWLGKQMNLQGFESPGDILLATVDGDGQLSIYDKNEDREGRQYFA